MDLLNENDIINIVKQCGVLKYKNLKWFIENYSDKLVGYLGEHLSLTVDFEVNNTAKKLIFFIKCIPRLDKWKANYLRENDFFKKEYVMLNDVFIHFNDYEGIKKWRPKLFYIKKEVFVFEDVTKIGYSMPSSIDVLNEEELRATVSSLARFHAQSYIYEKRKSQELRRPYEIWEEYSQYLYEPLKGKSWRDTGMRGAIDFLKVFSRYKSQTNFNQLIEQVLPTLFASADELMKPSKKFKNVIIHRDIWSNNIFLKKLENGQLHALLVDFQTVLYCQPMLDLSSLMYFNTTKSFRNRNTNDILEYYYSVIDQELKLENMNIESIIDKENLKIAYEESIIFGITQGILIVPIATMPDRIKKEVFNNPETMYRINCISRSQEFIELASQNEIYQNRVLDILEEVVERFMYPSLTETKNDLSLNEENL